MEIPVIFIILFVVLTLFIFAGLFLVIIRGIRIINNIFTMHKRMDEMEKAKKAKEMEEAEAKEMEEV